MSAPISFHPTDIGFDLRGSGVRIEIPRGILTVRYLNAEGQDTTITDGRARVMRALRAAGYALRADPPSADRRIAVSAARIDAILAATADHIRDMTQREIDVRPCACPHVTAPAEGYVVAVTMWSGRERVDHDVRVHEPPERTEILHFTRVAADAHAAQLSLNEWHPKRFIGEFTPTPLQFAVARPVANGDRWEAWLGLGSMMLSLGSHPTESAAEDVAKSHLIRARAHLADSVAPIQIRDGGRHYIRLADSRMNAWDEWADGRHQCSAWCQ